MKLPRVPSAGTLAWLEGRPVRKRRWGNEPGYDEAAGTPEREFDQNADKSDRGASFPKANRVFVLTVS